MLISITKEKIENINLHQAVAAVLVVVVQAVVPTGKRKKINRKKINNSIEFF
jgi:hypothetical protein